jgi:UDP-N-acetylglucosamine--N-acetylmuramyl-(pentapeptide) pyrophosphoryl-undecaprenol N-acetylglucosamine transferase
MIIFMTDENGYANVDDRVDGLSTMNLPPSLCLAASGGGHIRQILDLEPLWKDYPHIVITEATALGQSIALEHPTRFVPHFALGQARLGSPLKMIGEALRSCFMSARLVARAKPDVVLTTGAGSQIFVVLWARSRGARVYLIDSFARFDHPSAFARFAGPFANVRIAQSAAASRNWPGSLVFDPFRLIDEERPVKEALMFVTVGATLPFPRMVEMVINAKAKGLIPERVIIQTGTGCPPLVGHLPVEGIEFVETMPFDAVQDVLSRADIVVCHGGTGSIITALRAGCRIVSVPRLFALAEHYDDHQAEITRAFAARGLLERADDDTAFAVALDKVRSATPQRATTDMSALIAFLREDIATWWSTRSKRRQ